MDSPKPREPLWTSTTSCCLPRPKLLERPGIKHFLNRLQFGEVVAATDRAQATASNSVDSSSCSARTSLHDCLPRVFEVEAQLGPAVELDVAPDQVGLEQRHAATDVAADEVRIDHVPRSQRPRRPGCLCPGANPENRPPGACLRVSRWHRVGAPLRLRSSFGPRRKGAH